MAEVTSEQGLIEWPGDEGTIVVHRRERVFARWPDAQPIRLRPPPRPLDDDGQGLGWSIITPIVGSLSLVAFAFIIRNPIFLAVAFVVVVGMTLAVVGGRLASRRAQRRRWRLRRAHWLAHAAHVRQQAEQAAHQQIDALIATYPAPGDLRRSTAHDGSLWERRPGHADFLTVRLGTGPVPATAPIASELGADLAEADAELARYCEDLVRAHGAILGAPVTVDLARLSSLAASGPGAREAVCSILAQAAAACSPADVRIMGLVASPTSGWEWLKWLPHTRDLNAGEGFGRSRRGVTTDPAIFADLLATMVAERAVVEGDDERSAAARLAVLPHVLVVVEGYRPDGDLAQHRALRALLARGASYRVTVLLTVDDPAAVPRDCSATLTPRYDVTTDVATTGHSEAGHSEAGDGRWTFQVSGPEGRVTSGIVPDSWREETVDELARWMAPRVPGRESVTRRDAQVRLSELLGVQTMGELGAGPAWRPARSIYDAVPAEDLLVAPVGIDDDGNPVRLNLREAAHDGDGPHGVMVGATGSGKSELLRTMVAGLAATHPPEQLSILAIDFKGGTAFTGLDKLPHMVGLITNLEEDPALIDRMQASLDGEVQRRQALLVGAGVDNVTSYRALPTNESRETLPFLFVVIDEFSELLATRPDFITSLVAIGRLGRALGIHMLLATQRLDEGRLRGLDANLRYRIALRTFTAQDSRQILGSAIAHELPPLPGLGYLKVDSGTVRFKAALSTLPQRTPDRALSRDAVLVRPFDLGPGLRTAPTHVPAAAPRASNASSEPSSRTELEALTDRIVDQALDTPRPVWLPPLPQRLMLDQLWRHPGPSVTPSAGAVRFGLVDHPAQQRQDTLTLNPRSGHVAIVGSPQSGKSTALRSLALAAVHDRAPDDVQVYALDSGGGLAALDRLPHTGAVAMRHQLDASRRLLADLHAVAAERSTACREAGVSTLADLRVHPDVDTLLPHPLRADIWVLIDNVGILRSDLPDEEMQLGSLAATCLPLSIRFAIAAGRWFDIRPALLDAMGTRIELRLNDPNDSQISRPQARLLADLPGRGLVGGGHQMQIALPVISGPGASPEPNVGPGAGPGGAVEGAAGDEERTLVAVATATGLVYPGQQAPQVLPLPTRVTPAELPALTARSGRLAHRRESGDFLLAVHEHRMTSIAIDLLRPGGHLSVFGDRRTGKTTLLRRCIDHLADQHSPDDVAIHLVDLNRGLIEVADDKHVASYAFTMSQSQQLVADLLSMARDRLAPPDLTRQQLIDRSWWSGPEHVLVLDDYQLLIRGADGPLGPLADALSHAHDIGLHVLCARTVTGAARSMYETFGKRLAEMQPTLVLLPGESTEGPVAGGMTAREGPPGRANVLLPGGTPSVGQLLDRDHQPDRHEETR